MLAAAALDMGTRSRRSCTRGRQSIGAVGAPRCKGVACLPGERSRWRGITAWRHDVPKAMEETLHGLTRALPDPLRDPEDDADRGSALSPHRVPAVAGRGEPSARQWSARAMRRPSGVRVGFGRPGYPSGAADRFRGSGGRAPRAGAASVATGCTSAVPMLMRSITLGVVGVPNGALQTIVRRVVLDEPVHDDVAAQQGRQHTGT